MSPEQVVAVEDALLANADRLLNAALAVLDLGSFGLARSLAILGMEESGKAIAIHERRVEMAYAPEGEPFVTKQLNHLWASHPKKLRLVHSFLVDEPYWFDTIEPDRDGTAAYLGTIERWTERHNTLKQQGFYVDLDDNGDAVAPQDVAEEESLADVVRHVHQIGWQLRLGEHIEAKQQAQWAEEIPPATEEELEETRKLFSGVKPEVLETILEAQRRGKEGRELHNDGYRLHLPGPGSNPFENLGKPGYEAGTRELIWLSEDLDKRGERDRSEP
ncbi:abortive infection protein, AbiV family [Nocardioides terrae]|uniref:Abortive infection protein, AbiV family n=1 Tax=Nocardioides terrae TaxID=574651 RepID=A0A1I1LYC5_9ACTN|nr:AbiV family abortive infection protein [Nocardioides terrae]SFC74470.1 abortive infection protein, AbiV family [Nocardioides terrae]